MIDGNLALQIQPKIKPVPIRDKNLVDIIWTQEDHANIVEELKRYGCKYLKGREEYTFLKEVVSVDLTQEPKSRQTANSANPLIPRAEGSGVISPYGVAIEINDTDTESYYKPFMAPLDVQKSGSIADVIPSFKVIQSSGMSLNIGFDTEFQDYRTGKDRKNRRVLSLQMSIVVGNVFIRYFFLVDPRYQEVTADGGLIPLKYCLADVLEDLKNCYFPDFPLVRKEKFIYTEKQWHGHDPYKVLDFAAMRDSVIPITIICHTGKADISVFRRSEYDIDILRELSEIQGGWMTTKTVRFSAANDKYRNNYWLVNLCVRDTLGLTPADNKSLKALGNVIKRPKIELPGKTIEHMAVYAVTNPVGYYQYAMNDADIVVSFCAELFRCNHAVPMTLSSAAASAMCSSIKKYFGVKKKADYDRIYRGLEMLDEGPFPSKGECMKFLRATRYVPIKDNPDARIVSEYFEEAYTGGFNASFNIGWITEQTNDFDLQNAYPTAMANIIDIDWNEHIRDLPRDTLRLQDLINPLVPSVAVGDFDFPDDCYCPNIPVPVKGGLKIYPRHGRNVYMSGPDMWLALKLGATIKIFRGFTCPMLETKDGKPSQCLAYAVTNLVQDRMLAKKVYKDNPLVERSLKTMVNSCYGKTAQNVDPKTRYNAKKMNRVDAKPSTVTSPYHATYTTALVRCMLIGCINQLHNMGYHVYSVTTDGFITDAPTEVVRGLDAYGFAQIFQNGRYILNQTRENCDANQVWVRKHYNNTLLNITTRGNVGVNDEGVLAHNSYTTGEEKGSRADRDAFIIAVLSREGRLKCSTNVWTRFSDQVERKHDFGCIETFRELSMNFDYKRCPIVETAHDVAVHYESPARDEYLAEIDILQEYVDKNEDYGDYTVSEIRERIKVLRALISVDTVISEFDTRPFEDVEEFLNYRKTMCNEDCVKVTADLERVKVKSTAPVKGYIGKDLPRKILLSILMGYRSKIYQIPALDGLKQSEIVNVVNSWGISQITLNDWKNCSRSQRQENMLPCELVDKTLQKILKMSSG